MTIDWAVKETARAKLRTMVKRILRKHGYPPDKQEKATQTVLGLGSRRLERATRWRGYALMTEDAPDTFTPSAGLMGRTQTC